MKKLIVLFLATLFSANQAFAATTPVSAVSNVKIVPVMTINKNAPLEFGSIATVGATGGTVTIAAVSGTVIPTSSNVTVLSTGATRTAGSFDITGEPNTTYTLTALPSLNLTGPGTAMPVTLTSSADHALNASGTNTLFVGGTLTVGANQTPGSYTGSYNVTVSY